MTEEGKHCWTCMYEKVDYDKEPYRSCELYTNNKWEAKEEE